MYATTILDTSAMKAWERAMLFVAKSPLGLTFGGGTEIKHALDSQASIILDENAVNELLNEQWHPSDPFCTPERIKAYKMEYKKEFDASTFDYTYRDILENSFTNPILSFDETEIKGWENINQIDILRAGLQQQINENMGSNRNIAVLFNPVVDNFSGKAIPCFNEILIRWESTGYCSIHTTFRSHDLSAWNANMLALTEFINEEIVKPCECKIQYWSEHNYSLHIYDYALNVVENLKVMPRNPMLANKQRLYEVV
ncbi:hypothetical protein KAW18_18955 [candidate division WOR-3 bacterium]|nr:hypothetical protein [candidate division WOR-3 bacterium]